MGDKQRYWIGFDLGGTKMMAVVFDAKFRVVGRERKKSKPYLGKEDGMRRVCACIDTALGTAGIPAGRLAGIGFGLPGALDLNRGSIIESPNLGWKEVAVRRKIRARYRCPVAVANDADAGLYGEYAMGAARGGRCVFGIFPGTGIGAGCVYNGELIRGAVGSCMEFGHVPVVPDGPLCGCGRRGCLETVASRLAISSAAAVAAYRGEAPALMKTAGCNLEEIRSATLADAIKKGDRAVEQIVRAAAGRIGRAAGGVVNLLSPDVIVLGGGLVEAMPVLYKEEVSRGIADNVMPAFRGTYKVAVAKLGDDAVAAGAAALAAQAAVDGRGKKG